MFTMITDFYFFFFFKQKTAYEMRISDWSSDVCSSACIASTKIFDEYEEAKALGYQTRPVLLGPVSYLMLAKGNAVEPLALLPALLGTYAEILARLAKRGADWVQIDEPCLVLDLTEDPDRQSGV